ncbi:MAG: 50S ribosomal protein L18 [Ignavibacteria bacterium RBG_13_36_8]|nr:MAG: 50S ribosomal protein L18 [Ignavibacteria bacterium RBG_13_36_8]
MFIKDYKRRIRKRIRVRKYISGTAERPRLSIFRSLTQIYAQLIDDNNGNTLVSASSLSKEISEDLKKAKSKIERGKVVGTLLAKKAVEKGIKTVVFDRSGYRYHGRIKAVADGAREGGLKF